MNPNSNSEKNIGRVSKFTRGAIATGVAVVSGPFGSVLADALLGPVQEQSNSPIAIVQQGNMNSQDADLFKMFELRSSIAHAGGPEPEKKQVEVVPFPFSDNEMDIYANQITGEFLKQVKANNPNLNITSEAPVAVAGVVIPAVQPLSNWLKQHTQERRDQEIAERGKCTQHDPDKATQALSILKNSLKSGDFSAIFTIGIRWADKLGVMVLNSSGEQIPQAIMIIIKLANGDYTTLVSGPDINNITHASAFAPNGNKLNPKLPGKPMVVDRQANSTEFKQYLNQANNHFDNLTKHGTDRCGNNNDGGKVPVVIPEMVGQQDAVQLAIAIGLATLTLGALSLRPKSRRIMA